jgi:hypothetical protein
LDDYPLETILTKPKPIAPRPTTKPIVTVTATYGATTVLTEGFPSFGMQNQSTAPAADNIKIPCTKSVAASRDLRVDDYSTSRSQFEPVMVCHGCCCCWIPKAPRNNCLLLLVG